MEIIAGECLVKLDGTEVEVQYNAGTYFDVPSNSGFDIKVSEGNCEYICSYLP
jgi:hypothetical protein